MEKQIKPVKIEVFAVYDGGERLSNFFLLEKNAEKARYNFIAKYKTPVIKRSRKIVGSGTSRRIQRW